MSRIPRHTLMILAHPFDSDGFIGNDRPVRRLWVLSVALVIASGLLGAGPVPSADAAAPPRPGGLPYWPGWDIARAVAIAPDGTGGFVLDGLGGLHGFGLAGNPAPRAPRNAPYWPGVDVARGLALRTRSSGYVLDAFGGIHPFGGAPRVNPATPPEYRLGDDFARGIALSADGNGLYTVRRAGGFGRVGIGTAPRPPRMAFLPSFSPQIAADVAMLGDGSGGFVLDGWGGFHHVGVPSVVRNTPVPTWPGWDIARGIALLPNRTGGFVLDGFGGLHPFGMGSGAPQLNVSVVAGGLTNPWDLGFTPDGWMIVTERPNGILAMRSDGSARRLLSRPADLLVASEAGAMGLAVDPGYAANRRIYVCFASRAAGRPDDVRLVRFTVDAATTQLTDRADILTGLPVNPVGELGRHSGCRPRFGPDGFLWVGTGDAAIGAVPQNLTSLGGKILRVDPNGAPAPGNPFIGTLADARIWSSGHRNVQGIAFAPGAPWWRGVSVEHGPAYDDELNWLVTGNFGWDPVPGYNESVPMTDLAKFPGAVSAIWASGSPTIAPSGATFLTGARWRAWRDALAVAVLKDRHLRIFTMRADGTVRATTKRLGLGMRLRTPVVGPDGNLYVTSDAVAGGDVILRVVPN